jgi:hypothetical protein
MRIPRDRAFRQALRRFHRPWYRRLLPWAMVLGALAIAGRVALGPLVERWSRDSLAQLQGFRGSYQRVDLFAWPPVYVVDGLRIESDAGAQVLSVERLEVHAELGDVLAACLWHRTPTVRVRLARPRVLLDGGTPVVLARELESWVAAQLPAMNIELAKVEDGEILLGPEKSSASGAASGKLTTFMAALNASAYRSDPAQPLVVKGTAALLGSGDSSFHLRMPVDPEAAVSGDLSLRYLSLGDVYWLVEQPLPPGEQGRTLAVGGRFTLEGAELRASVRGSGENLGPGDLPAELVERVRARFASAAPWVIAERRPGEDATALAVQGSLSPAGTGRWLQSLSAARTVFVEGVGAASASVVTSVSPGGPSHAGVPAPHAPVVAGSIDP